MKRIGISRHQCPDIPCADLVRQLVVDGIEGVAHLVAEDAQNGDYNECNQRDKQAILYQCLSFFLCKKTFQHVTPPDVSSLER